MNTLFLYSLVVLIWGSTWFVITYQLHAAAPEVSVFIRFFIASVVGFLICILKKKNLKFSMADHRWFLLQGLFMFCLNYILTYYSETFVSSGLIAVTFTLVLYFNMIGMGLLYHYKIDRPVIWGSVLGAFGIFCLFYREFGSFETHGRSLTGLAVGITASFFASMGNLVAIKVRKKNHGVLECNSWSMLYGSLLTALIALISGKSFHVAVTPSYIFSLLYLAVFGSIIAFFAYITLLGRIGADRASYSGIVTPVIALLLSTFFEGFHWEFLTFLGVFLSLLGNFLVLRKRREI